MKVRILCPNCGKLIEVLESKLKHAKNVYCSKECSYVAKDRKKMALKRNKQIKTANKALVSIKY